MEIIPPLLTQIIQADKNLNKALLDIDSKVEAIVKKQSPIFFSQYTDHGIYHFIDTLKMAHHLIDIDEVDRQKGHKAVVDYISPLNAFALVSSILFHDLGMHIHFKGFKQLIDGFYDDVRVDFFNDSTWKQEWDNFFIEAKRFSGRERINLFGDEQAIINEIDFTKSSVDSDVQKTLIGEFIRRHHGRLAHEIALKGFPSQGIEVINFASDLKTEYKDIIGVIARSHSMNVRDALGYIEDTFPADPHFPYEIEVPFLMCVLRVADYFQFDSSRTNAFLIKLKSFTSRFSEIEHETHLATEYFKTDEKDPETLFVDLKPKDGLMYTKLIRLFADIQKELDTSFAINGEMYGRTKDYLKLRYRRVKTNLSNRKVINKLPYIAEVFRFEADTDLFKLLVGPLYGYDPSYGIREVIQNAIDACIELRFKMGDTYAPLIEINVDEANGEYTFKISDNGKGMSIGEIKNYYLKAGASFRNSTEWKIDYQTEDNTSAIRRTGKFGIGVLASFLIGNSLQITTKRYNENTGYTFTADLNCEFIEIRKDSGDRVGTTIEIKMSKENYDVFVKDNKKLTQWFVLTYPPVHYYLNKAKVPTDDIEVIELKDNKQILEDSVTINNSNFEDIIWTYKISKDIAINGILIPSKYYYPSQKDYYGEYKKKKNIYDELDKFPFVSLLDRNNLVDLELSRNAIRGHLPFMRELVKSCKLDFLYKLIFFKCPITDSILDLTDSLGTYSNDENKIILNTPQFSTIKIYTTTEGYFPDNIFYNPIVKSLNYYKIFGTYSHKNQIELIDKSVCSLTKYSGINGERNIVRGDYRSYIAIAKPDIYLNNENTSSITKSVRDRISVIERNDDYIIFSNGNYKTNHKSDLIKLFSQKNVEAVQLIDQTLRNHENLNKLLKEHCLSPTLIPHDFEEKKKYVKTLSEELQKHIEEKRGINL